HPSHLVSAAATVRGREISKWSRPPEQIETGAAHGLCQCRLRRCWRIARYRERPQAMRTSDRLIRNRLEPARLFLKRLQRIPDRTRRTGAVLCRVEERCCLE